MELTGQESQKIITKKRIIFVSVDSTFYAAKYNMNGQTITIIKEGSLTLTVGLSTILSLAANIKVNF